MSDVRLCRYEFTSESSFETGSRGATCYVVRYDGRFPDSGPAELIDKAVQIDGKLYRCTGVEMFAVTEQSTYPQGLTFGIVVDPCDRDEFVLGHVPYLLAEVLAARLRTGENFWTFPVAFESAAHVLRDCGLVAMVQSGTIEDTIRVWLSGYGKDYFLDADYVPSAFRGAATAPSAPQEPEPAITGILGPDSHTILLSPGTALTQQPDGTLTNAEPVTVETDEQFYARHPLPRPHLIAEVTSIAEETVTVKDVLPGGTVKETPIRTGLRLKEFTLLKRPLTVSEPPMVDMVALMVEAGIADSSGQAKAMIDSHRVALDSILIRPGTFTMKPEDVIGKTLACGSRHPVKIVTPVSEMQESLPTVEIAPIRIMDGWPRVEFEDARHAIFRLGKSTLATDHQIWFGHHSWLAYLSQEQVRSFLPYLVHFAYRGELRCAAGRDEWCEHDGMLADLSAIMVSWERERWVLPS